MGKHSLANIFSLFYLSGFIELVLAQKSTHFHQYVKYKDTYCSSPVITVFQNISLFKCCLKCGRGDECTGLFYNTISKNCSLFRVVSIPEDGCTQQTGSNYHVRMGYYVFDEYSFTSSDLSRSVNNTLEDICLGYPYHVLNSDVGALQTRCGSAYCCKTKGCYSGDDLLYKGTWAATHDETACLRWDHEYRHWYLTRYGTFVGETMTEAQNYCRNPNDFSKIPRCVPTHFEKNGLWCHTTIERMTASYKYCDIPSCP